MNKTGMMDRNAIGIRNVFYIQRGRLLPMPTYDLSRPARVSVTLYGTVLNVDYSRLLASSRSLDLVTVLLLDLVQKGLPISKEQSRLLHDRKLVRGAIPSSRSRPRWQPPPVRTGGTCGQKVWTTACSGS